MNIALIIAGGVGARMHQSIPKQFISINDKPVVIYTLEKFQSHAAIDVIAVVCLKGWEHLLVAYAKQFSITKLRHVISGGINGQESIKNGLFELEKFYNKDDIILIHDAIRPNVSSDIISDCIMTIQKKGSAVVVIPCNEAMLISNSEESSLKSFPREQLKRTQTPQGASLGKLLSLHKRANELGITNSVATCTLMTELGEEIFFSFGSSKNIKITTQEDIEIFKALLNQGH